MAKKQKSIDKLIEEALVPRAEQPFEVPENWKWVRVKAVLEDMISSNPLHIDNKYFQYIDVDAVDNSKQEIKQVKKLRIEDAPSRARRKVKSNDVIISMVRPYLKNIAKIKGDVEGVIASTAFYVCSPKNGLLTDYLYYYLCSAIATKYLISKTRGDNSPSVKNTDFESMPFPLPPIEEQKRIVKKVELLLSKIDEAKQLIEKAKESFELRRASILNKSIRGFYTKDFREESVRKNEVLKADKFTEKLLEPPFQLPIGWVWVKLEDILKEKKSLSYGILKPGEMDTKGIPMIRVMDIGKGKYNETELFKVSKELNNEYKRTQTEEGDILLAIMATIGRAVVVDKDHKNMNVNRAIAVIKIRNDVNSKFICNVILSPYFQKVFVENKIGSAQSRINLSDLRKFLIPLPPLKEQEKIVEAIEGLNEGENKLDNLIDKLRQLDNLKQSIMYKAFRGELGTSNSSDFPPVNLL
ncbi:restriction endonuclease subunit S [Terribacillus sp. AE2B 122]|uniref:restriction endonuclease subunit S n=1 Tax=Terribacillus sp. AE2B 122 TaxID=1331902 RepID=UPI001440B1AA|nr:restriction endonuclease subunit S [Terribacillus sp. AE2B 122]VVM32904.1 Type I restriction-modification system2C specificity subunit S (EC 3.1.21.3) [Terribacillus sp. AE2B 122]